MKMTKLNLDSLVNLYKRNSRMKLVRCVHCSRTFIVDKRELRVDNMCNACK